MIAKTTEKVAIVCIGPTRALLQTLSSCNRAVERAYDREDHKLRSTEFKSWLKKKQCDWLHNALARETESSILTHLAKVIRV